MTLEARLLRKPGQGDLIRRPGVYAGQFESWTRFEVSDPSSRSGMPPDYPYCRGNGMKPSRFGIFTFGSDCASSTSSAPMMPLRSRM